ncbi:family 43 glycosylhydrolase [Microbacterium sp. G2-8]|uniref:family 43 glycosylhydrolase n=1 Tax=Microbacterium sp. G2-8 TaxID=2842454 RepID=UPI0027E34B62|nr:family 43 glycosylhydrolase [Microbacterium sp. G2-8]
MISKKSTPVRLLAAAAAAAAVALVLGPAVVAPAATQNPLIEDGSVYSADPSLLVADDTLYIHAGRDEAPADVNDFIMNEWQGFSTTDVDSGEWQHHPNLMRPEEVFDWASPGRAYAGQAVEGTDGRFYWYVPVHEEASASADKFGIGVAVSDSPLGPWADHAGGPIVSQEILGNDAHNIDPTVLVDGERVWMLWGSFGRLLATELAPDMKTRVGEPLEITSGVDGFFEAPWLFERAGTYYLAYAANDAGPSSDCTPAVYHACIAYSTAPEPLGPWTHQGTILEPVSSTTSHPAIAEFQGEWQMAYHTADAEGGGHFRRSVAIDRLEWDDSQTPARILPVVTTPEQGPDLTPRSNVAPWATASASNEPIPTQYWIAALNDGRIRANPLPPDMWGNWSSDRPAQEWIRYEWETPVRVDRARIEFWSDAAAGSGDGVAPPAAWRLQYWEAGAWKDVPDPSGYPTSPSETHEVTFGAVTTSRLRAVIDASPDAATVPRYSGVAVQEWEVHAVQPDGVAAVEVATDVGVAPVLPSTVDLAFGDERLPAAVRWDAVDEASYAAPGTFLVEGAVEGYAAGTVQASVTVRDAHPWRTNLALAGAPEAESMGDSAALAALNDDVIASPGDAHPTWSTGAVDGADTRWVGYTWPEPVVTDAVEAHFWVDDAGTGLPAEWDVQALVDGAWIDVAEGPTAEPDSSGLAAFDAVATTGIRAVLTAPPEGGDLALGELRVFGEPSDVTAPEVSLEIAGTRGADGWIVSPAAVRATASDDHDLRVRVDLAAGDGPWQSHEDVRVAELALLDDGEHVVRARAVDAAGNVSDEASTTVRIDTAAPTVSGEFDAASRSVVARADDELSGAARIEYVVDAATDWAEYTDPIAVDEQRHRVRLRAVDVAGNVSPIAAVDVPLSPDAPLEGNVASLATPSASYTSGWNSVDAVNDESLTGSSWGTWPEVGEQWVQLEWDREVTLDRAGVLFFRDAADEDGAGMIPPRSWILQYADPETGEWRDVATPDSYGRSSDDLNEVGFETVTTTRLRIVMQSWGEESGGGSSGILEFEAHAAPAPASIELAVTPRCTGGRGFLGVTVENASGLEADISLHTAYGTRPAHDLAPGDRASRTLPSRTDRVPAGEIVAEATFADGSAEDVVAEYDELLCG